MLIIQPRDMSNFLALLKRAVSTPHAGFGESCAEGLTAKLEYLHLYADYKQPGKLNPIDEPSGVSEKHGPYKQRTVLIPTSRDELYADILWQRSYLELKEDALSSTWMQGALVYRKEDGTWSVHT